MAQGLGKLEQELIKCLQGFELTEEELDETFLNEDDTNGGVNECRFSCYRKIFAYQEILIKFLKLLMAKA